MVKTKVQFLTFLIGLTQHCNYKFQSNVKSFPLKNDFERSLVYMYVINLITLRE